MHGVRGVLVAAMVNPVENVEHVLLGAVQEKEYVHQDQLIRNHVAQEVV